MQEADLSILRHFAGIRDVTIELLRRAPDDWLERPLPGEGGWTPRHAFMHIAGGQCGWLAGLGDGKRPIDENAPMDKAGIERTLREARKRMLDFFGSSEVARMGHQYADDIGRDVVLYLTSHEVHHRGRIVAALWQWGMTDTPFEPREQPLKHDPLGGGPA